MLDLRYKSKGGDTRELQSRMVPPQKTGSSHLSRFDRFYGYFLSGWMSWFLYWLTKTKKSIYWLTHVVEGISPK